MTKLYTIYTHPAGEFGTWNLFYVSSVAGLKPAAGAKIITSIRLDTDSPAVALANVLNGRYSRPRASVTAVETSIQGMYEVEVAYK